MKSSLIITTYNRPDALELVLLSIQHQITPPDEIIIADDGSDENTKLLVLKYQKLISVPLIHVWQKDNGFRAAGIRNLAIKHANGDYLIFIDGDMILHENFIKSHVDYAEPSFFVQGHRVLINEQLTKEKLVSKSVDLPFFTLSIRNRFNAFQNSILTNLFNKEIKGIKGVKTCNFACWKTDAIKVNGFNEEFVGWGKEDAEFAIRLLNSEVKRKDLRFAGIAYHLDHQENNKNILNENYKNNLKLLNIAITERLTTCKNGIAQL